MSGLVQQSEVARQKQLADPATAYVAACLAVRDQHADIRCETSTLTPVAAIVG